MGIFNYKKIDKLEYLNNKPFSHIQLNDCWESSFQSPFKINFVVVNR